MTVATGIGSMPAHDGRSDGAAFLGALRTVLEGLTQEGGLPYLPELPGRGAIAGMTGRSLAVVSGLGVDLQPAGWRLTDASGLDHRRARSLLAQDLDGLEEQTEGYAGTFKIQVAGPWT
ncbi:MAG: methionine synthase, partial [Nocardioides sp.]|nr:methionine synthase [Nocardioides sp.]